MKNLSLAYEKVRQWQLNAGLIPFELQLIRNSFNSFLTWHQRPKIMNQGPSDGALSFSEFGIVLQGPVLWRSDFTLQSALGYSRLFPGVNVVLSTWEDEHQNLDDKAKKLGIQVIYNSRPKDPGPANLNLQMTSTAAGLEYLVQRGAKYALKSRTDQRIYSGEALTFLRDLLQNFEAPDQRPRLVGVSLNSFLNRDYGLSDMFQFSTTDELLTFWSGEQIAERDRWDGFTPEAHLTSKWLLRRLSTESLPSWAEALAEYIVIADAGSLDLLWPKYSRREYLWRRYETDPALTEVSFAKWLSLAIGNGDSKRKFEG